MANFLNHLSIGTLLLLPFSTQAADFEWSNLGFRIGIDSENKVEVESFELMTTLDSPWSWAPNEQIEFDLGFELGLGAIRGEGKTGFLAHAGPTVELNLGDFPVDFIVSSGPAVLSEDEFDTLDLGGSFQFMSAVGFNFQLSSRWEAGYRWLHISNAGLRDQNPGMNFHALSFFYQF